MCRNLKFLHMTDFFSMGTARRDRDKYQVWLDILFPYLILNIFHFLCFHIWYRIYSFHIWYWIYSSHIGYWINHFHLRYFHIQKWNILLPYLLLNILYPYWSRINYFHIWYWVYSSHIWYWVNYFHIRAGYREKCIFVGVAAYCRWSLQRICWCVLFVFCLCFVCVLLVFCFCVFCVLFMFCVCLFAYLLICLCVCGRCVILPLFITADLLDHQMIIIYCSGVAGDDDQINNNIIDHHHYDFEWSLFSGTVSFMPCV